MFARIRSLVSISLVGLTGLATLGWALLQFLDNLAFLLAENDPRTMFVLLGILAGQRRAVGPLLLPGRSWTALPAPRRGL